MLKVRTLASGQPYEVAPERGGGQHERAGYMLQAPTRTLHEVRT